jgi:beta propeller repeat protein
LFPLLLGTACGSDFGTDRASPPADGQARQALGATAKKPKFPEQVPSQILVKFRDDAPVGAVADQLLDARERFTRVAPGSRLDELNARYGATRARNLLSPNRPLRRLSGTVDRDRAKALNDRDRAEFARAFAARPQAALAQDSAQTPARYLGNLYRVDFDRRDVEPAQAAAEYAADPNVEYAVPNYVRQMEWVPNDPAYPQQWAHQRTSMESAWNTQRGNSNVVIAVIDSGVDYAHEDLSANIWHDASGAPGRDFVDLDTAKWIDDGFSLITGEDYVGVDAEPMDFGGHGTHCAGIAAATTNNARGVASVAHRSRVMPVRAGFSITHPWYGEVGVLDDATIVPALHYAADNGAKVISMSFGSQADSAAIHDAVRYAYSAGALLVAAAGNSNTSARFYPAAYDEVVAVAATNRDNARSSYSNFGVWVDIAAPGGEKNADNQFSPDVSILSTVPKMGGFLTDPSGYASAAGTSMAAPYAAGVAALLAAQYPSAQRDELRGRLIATTDAVVGDTGSQVGSGRVNAQRALTASARPFLQLRQFDIQETVGNRNRFPEPGETANILVTLENVWSSVSSGTVTLSSSSPAIAVTQPSFSLGAMATGQRSDNTASPFVVEVKEAARDTSVDLTLAIQVTMSNGTRTTQSLKFQVPLGIGRVTSSNDVVFSPVVGEHTTAFARVDWDLNQVNVYAVDLRTSQETRVTHVPEYSLSPIVLPGEYVVSDAKIVFTDTRDGDPDVYAYDMATGTESVVCNAPGQQARLNLSGNVVVWEDDRSGNADIYAFDLVTGQETPVATGALPEIWPKVAGKKVAYSAPNGSLDEDIYIHDLTTGQTSLAVSAPTIQRPLEYSNNWLLYLTGVTFDPEDELKPLKGTATFVARNLATGEETVLYDLAEPNDRNLFPTLSGNNVVWRNDATNIDVFTQNLKTGEQAQLTTHPSAQYAPSIWGNRVVWSDNREGNAVYWTELGPELGDANGDSSVDIVDALVVAQHYVGTAVGRFFPDAADVNCDGNADIVDALMIAQHYVGSLAALPCEPN